METYFYNGLNSEEFFDENKWGSSVGKYIDNPEYLQVTFDKEDKVLEGIQSDGTKVIGGDITVGGSAKIIGNMEFSGVSYKIIESPEYLVACVDAEDKLIFGFRADGKTYVGDAEFLNEIKNNQNAINEIKSYLANFDNLDIDALSSIMEVENPEFIEVKTDSEDKLLAGRTSDGAAFENVGFSTPKVSIDGHIIENIEDPEGRSEITTDYEDKIISYRDSEGVKHENAGIETNHLGLSKDGMTEFQQALKDSGFNSGVGDWSDAKSLEIPIPNCAIINITNPKGIASWPQTKMTDAKYYMEFWDMGGNYFKKEIIFNAQGSSSMAFIKKNGAIDICNNNGWDDEDTFSIKFGDWVAQDSFHIKAYYTDFIKGSAVISYQICEQIMNSRGSFNDRPWKKALIDFNKLGSDYATNHTIKQIDDLSLQVDNGAMCMPPPGFPVMLYLNGDFYGIYVWQIKKHRDNYHMSKKKAKHIHLDDASSPSVVFSSGGNIGWTTLEVRNPKSMVYSEAHNGTYKYDADDPGCFAIAGNSDGSMTYDTWTDGSYPINKIVKHEGHYYINTVQNNTSAPILDGNKDDSPDYKNKTGCGWINCTLSVNVKHYVVELSKRLGEISNLCNIQYIRPDEQVVTFDNYYGIYNNETLYTYGNCVFDGQGSYYMSIRYSNVGNSLTDTEYWYDITTEFKALRNKFEEYFDSDNLIDYILGNTVVNDTDGYGNNCQWITYNGVKWYATFYDKDMAFGNLFYGHTIRPVPTQMPSIGLNLPFGYVYKLYKPEMVNRYHELVEFGIFTYENIYGLVKNWINRIGYDNYDKEYSKWKDSPCCRDSAIDTEYWDLTDVEVKRYSYSGTWKENTTYLKDSLWIRDNRLYKALKNNTNVDPKTDDGTNWLDVTWDYSKNYAIGDSVYYGYANFFIFTAKKASSPSDPKPPLKKFYIEGGTPQELGYYDTEWRLSKYISETLENMKIFINN